MGCILAVQLDSTEACALRQALLADPSVEFVVVESPDAALSAIDTRLPDLILLPAFIAPDAEDHIISYLRALADSHHVQTIRIPILQGSHVDYQPRRVWRDLLKPQPRTIPVACNPRLYADEVLGYLSRACAMREDTAYRRALDDCPRSVDRRTALRWSASEVPRVAAVRLAVEPTELINFSWGGVLVRSQRRPQLPSVTSRFEDAVAQPRVTLHLVSGEEVAVAGRVVRCHVRSAGTERVYEVAVRFDKSVEPYVNCGLQPCR